MTRTEARPVPAAGGPVSYSPGTFAGYSLRETAGAGAVVNVYDGSDNNGLLLATVALAANESATELLTPHGPAFAVGLFVELAAGQVAGAVYLAPA